MVIIYYLLGWRFREARDNRAYTGRECFRVRELRLDVSIHHVDGCLLATLG